ncbi:hypothetical protein LTR91_022473 [Friedmanniomyces endolithicus]|uniref:Dol-P-Man:Man(5)GlcNAc(2)-PP-Dol alpha-1,3-mannosyltransferase n=1 Tax=Friedmanniomyces endolithicus TaxID=329885 RepID=A0AAN6H3Y3_9PEZI|nr:hypothetical protein LTR94_019015 [Friedmanniomyces endolithicus]KAK0780075.1 hypothetical protein LTR75_015149 [Friedmanniomyces endolithicus]KAK0798428.1 hypothetical protein LTR59_006433 [Friedmanniomyces endolithicus]KAK0811322.1 hypothetical protein LTR38_003650 [Friedmanniomyces endolithicus]KAK0827603.1 hypothetical protein LTR03_016817 [Friedmanniomyces endolithicus]
MSKLSEPLKAFINAAHARPNTTPAPRHIASVYEKIAKDAGSKKVGMPAWLTVSTAATMTMNSPQSLLELYGLATSPNYNKGHDNKVWTAELMREVGLKCIGLNGVPRTINSLGAFYNGLPQDVQTELQKRKPRRNLTPQTLPTTLNRGNILWESIYHPFSSKLTSKLAQSHPDLPVFIIEAEYGALFSDPPNPNPNVPNIGRVLMSLLAVAVLRAQTGVGPQVVSHMFGLRKAFEDGTAAAEESVEGGEWLAGDEGGMWVLGVVDGIVGAIGEGRGTSFAPGGEKAKL